jgi:hypothetical protein
MASAKKNSEITARSRVPNPREQKLAPARHALRDLDDDDLAEVVLDELNRRGGNLVARGKTAKPSTYEAVVTSVLALLGVERGKLAARLAAVGRGVAIRSTGRR